MENTANKTCFVIMPFGEKPDVDGQILDFDRVYQFIIKQAVESLGIQCIRCDEIAESGWIHADMFEQILEADVSIVDITSLNANVFYELGIRHALSAAVTVLIRKKGTHAPFNIQGLRVIDYDPRDLASADKAKRQIASFIHNGLQFKLTDSPIHQVLENRLKVVTQPELISRSEQYEYQLSNVENKSICLVTGDIQDVRNIDIWVNSENSNMQMDRYYDSSISSIIRYLGALKDDAGCIVDDTIANELEAIMAGRESVVPAHVIVTSSGALEKTHNVKKIFHAASVIGAVGQGYKSIQRINRCITNALHKVDTLEDNSLSSILFPLMGTGKMGGNLQINARLLIEAAISYLETKQDSAIERVCFLNYTEEELETCQDILSRSRKVGSSIIKA